MLLNTMFYSIQDPKENSPGPVRDINSKEGYINFIKASCHADASGPHIYHT